MYRLLTILCSTKIIRSIQLENDKRHPRIIDGESIEIEVAPYQVSILQLSDDFRLVHECGGSIITKNHVLAAARCVTSGLGGYFVKSGTTFWNVDGKFHDVIEVIKHDKFNRTGLGRLNHDVAILKVSPECELDGKKENIIELADEHDKLQVVNDAYVTGWGRTKNYTTTTGLQGLIVKIMDFHQCSEAYAFMGSMTKHNICANHPSGTKDFCTGDSGSPLVVKGKQVGIVSWSGPGCAIPERPGVYVNVAKYRTWINKMISKDIMKTSLDS